MNAAHAQTQAAENSVARAASTESARVLVVDDDAAVLRSYGRLLSAYGYRVQTAAGGAAALQALKASSFDVILSDVDMPGMSGVELLQHVHAIDPELPLVLVTGKPTLPSATAAVTLGALHYLTKPVETHALLAIVEEAAARRMMALDRRLVDRRATEAAKSERDASEAFDRMLGSLFMHYQPIVSWASKRVFGYEALLRSREPALPHPGAVLDAAERLGRTDDLGRTVRAKAPECMPRMAPSACLFVNLHLQDLLDEELFSGSSALARVARSVVLEITERAPLDGVADIKERVARLRAMGFRIAIDDLGAGYAGLAGLALLEPEIVKLDMSLVRNLDREPTQRVVVRTMMAMCKELGATVVGEGVETAAERDALADEGCDLMQGYLFARPGEAFPEPVL